MLIRHQRVSGVSGARTKKERSSANFDNRSTVTSEVKQTACSKSQSDYVWYCASYQRNRCHNKSSHFGTIGGKLRHCLHICSTCWRDDNVQLSHPECSASCPHAY
jgi:hypothetical protein